MSRSEMVSASSWLSIVTLAKRVFSSRPMGKRWVTVPKRWVGAGALFCWLRMGWMLTAALVPVDLPLLAAAFLAAGAAAFLAAAVGAAVLAEEAIRKETVEVRRWPRNPAAKFSYSPYVKHPAG